MCKPPELYIKELNGRPLRIFLRIFKKVEVAGDCWIWRGATSGEHKPGRKHRGGGYGKFSMDGCNMMVHRVMFSLIHGPIANNKQIDHKCRNRLCCNPEHLEQVTPKENMRRKTNGH